MIAGVCGGGLSYMTDSMSYSFYFNASLIADICLPNSYSQVYKCCFFLNSEMDVILHLCPQRSPRLSGLLSPLSLQDSEFTQQCQITSSDISCSRREGANGVAVDASQNTGTGSDLTVLINHLLWQSFE